MESSDKHFDVSNTPEYMKTYVNVMMSTLLETIQVSTDAKTRMNLLDSICRQQKQQIDVLNDTVTQLTNGIQSTNSEYAALDNKCTSTIAQLTADLQRANEEVVTRLNEVRVLSVFEDKYNAVKKELETVVNNYSAIKRAYEDLAAKHEELTTKYDILQEQSSAEIPTLEVEVPPTTSTTPPAALPSKTRKKQRSEDTDWT